MSFAAENLVLLGQELSAEAKSFGVLIFLVKPLRKMEQDLESVKWTLCN